MAAQSVPHPSTDRKRVKVYELRNNDWFDRGTGFCTASFNFSEDGNQRDPRVLVESEEQPDRVLLETRISREDGFHKQQETLIVWTEPSNGIDMALSFQEAEGCAMIWKFINGVQQQYHSANAQDDSLSDDLAMDIPNPISLPQASMANLADIESQLRMMSQTAGGRDALTKFVLTEDYIGKLIPLVSEAEDLEGLNELHRLCNIMKIIILLNDTSIIEHAVSDECVIGVVGALEYDPDFPSHKANHRQWLEGEGRYKEVVRIEDSQILRKIRQTIYRQIHEKQPPLTDSLIDLLLVEVDLGVKSQVSDALRVLLDQGPPVQAESFAKANGEFAARAAARLPPAADPQQDQFLGLFYEHSAAKLFQPLIKLKDRENLEFSAQQASMFTYLIEILCFFIRTHHHRSKFFVLQNDIVTRVGQLLACPEKFLKLVAIRFLRQLLNLQDEFYIKQLSEKKVIEPILDVLIATMPRDNLLSSACLEFFEFIKKENVKDLIKHVMENSREKIQSLSYLELFSTLVMRYDQTGGFTANLDYFLESSEEDVGEEEYWNTSDEEDDLQAKASNRGSTISGESPRKLVDYASDEDLDDNVEAGALSADEDKPDSEADESVPKPNGSPASVAPPPERLSEKRRREEDEEDDLGKTVQNKRRNSMSGNSSASATSGFIRKKKSMPNARDAGGGPRKIAISLPSNAKTGNEPTGGQPDEL